MSLGIATGAQLGYGSAFKVRVEARVTAGAPGLSIVGLADKSVGEAKERVTSALETNGLLSMASRAARIVVSLSPADKKKTGSHLDLAVATSCLSAARVIPSQEGTLLVGELSLDGSILPCRGVFAMVEEARRSGINVAIVPFANAAEAAMVPGVSVHPARSIREVVGHLSGKNPLPEAPAGKVSADISAPTVFYETASNQRDALRAAEIAISGGHNFAMIGPPGTGKTTVARACAEIMPTLSPEEAVEVARGLSLAGLDVSWPVARPFRSPHHTATYAALVGGGADLKAGEAARAHRGILFLDELPEFDRRSLDALREPLEEGSVHISRASGSVTYPARFSLIAAMNPCPCGFYGDERRECRCPPGVAARYQSRISGPLVDRIDVWAKVLPPRTSDVIRARGSTGEGVAARARVAAAREVQANRCRRFSLPIWVTNAELPEDVLKKENFEAETLETLRSVSEKLNLSARGLTRTMRVALTVADLSGSESVTPRHILEAISYRNSR